MYKAVVTAIACMIAILTLGETTTAVGQSLIRVAGETGFESVSSVWHDGKFVGLPGDVIEVETGDLDLLMRIGGAYYVKVAGRVGLQNIQIHTAEFQTDICANTDMVAKDPVEVGISDTGPVLNFQIALSNIIDTGRRPDCPRSMMMAPIQRAAIINFTSMPAGAEIWIDGEKQEYQTNVSLSIPFTKYREDKPYNPISVVVRAEGFVNQIHEVDISSRLVEANLEIPEQWAARVRR